MKLRLLAAAMFAVTTASRGGPPDLKVLQLQYEKALAERVTAVYDAGITQLNTGYLAGLERGIAEAKAAGNLSSVLGLEAEKKRVSSKEAMPAEDDEKTDAAVKKLRAVYRKQVAALEARREINRTPLLAAYTDSLKKLEAELTKADRVDEAKEVMDYRAKLQTNPLSATQQAVASGSQVVPVAESADLIVSGKKFAMGILREHELAFSNRNYGWENVPKKLNGMRCTTIAGGANPTISVKAKKDTVVQVFADPNEPGVKLDGWEKTREHFNVSNGKHEAFYVFTQKLKAGTEIDIPQGSWSGVMLLLPAK